MWRVGPTWLSRGTRSLTRVTGRRGWIRGAAAAAALWLALTGCVEADPSNEGADPPVSEVDRPAPSASDLAEPSPAASEPATAPAEPASPEAELPPGRDVEVTSITDGDTFRAGDERVRLIGIDTPEISGGLECFGREATDALTRLIPPGTRVRLVADVEPEDRYDRTLAYVYRLSDGAHVNLVMARDGYATPLTVPPNVAFEGAFADAAREAREAGRGLWSACPDDAPPTTAPSAAPGGGGQPGCEPAYPDVCIPPSPPDLDCGDIPHRNFRVLPPDPHRFDGGGDGWGCERP